MINTAISLFSLLVSLSCSSKESCGEAGEAGGEERRWEGGAGRRRGGAGEGEGEGWQVGGAVLGWVF